MKKPFKPRFSNPAFPESAQKQLWAKKIAEANRPKPAPLVYRGRGNHSVSELESLTEKYRDERDEHSREIHRLTDELKETQAKLTEQESRAKRLAYEVEQHQRVDYWAERGQAAEKMNLPMKNALMTIRRAITVLDPKIFLEVQNNKGDQK